MAIQPAMSISAEAGPSRAPYVSVQTLTSHSRSVTALSYSSDGRTLVSGGADGWVHIWDGETSEYIHGFKAHPQGINDLSISPDSLYLVTASDSLSAHLHQLRPSSLTPSPAPAPMQVYEGHTAPILSVAFSPTSNMLVTGSMDESAIIWDVKSGRSMRQLPAHSEAVWCVGWDASGGICITSSADGLIRLWDASSGQCLKTFDNDTNSPVSYAGFTPSSTYLYSSTLASTLRVYNIHTSKVLKTFRHASYVSERFPCPALIFTRPRPAARKQVNGTHEMGMDVDDSEPQPQTHRAEAWLVSGSENGKTVIWDVGSRNVVGVLEGHERPVVALAVRPDGRSIATGSLEPEKTIRIWRLDADHEP